MSDMETEILFLTLANVFIVTSNAQDEVCYATSLAITKCFIDHFIILVFSTYE